MHSKPELHHVLETAFKPSACEFTLTGDDRFSLKLTEPDSGAVELYVTGLSVSELSSSIYIARLVLSLREQRDLMKQMDLSMRRLG
jgi:hypothetical protein